MFRILNSSIYMYLLFYDFWNYFLQSFLFIYQNTAIVFPIFIISNHQTININYATLDLIFHSRYFPTHPNLLVRLFSESYAH